MSFGIFVNVGATIGALTSFGLSFTALSPLVIGGVVAALATIPLIACEVYLQLNSPGRPGGITLKEAAFFSGRFATSVVIGIGLAAITGAIFPGVTLTIKSPISTGILIGAIAPVVGMYVAEKVNDYIIEPIIEKVKECFSSRGQDEQAT